MKIQTDKKKIFEIILLVVSLILILITFLLSENKNVLSFVCSMVGCFAILCLAKGVFYAPMINVVYDILYSILAYTQNFYGEVIIYLLLTFPIDFLAIFQWKKNRKGENSDIKLNTLSKKEMYLFAGSTVILTISFYFILRAINTNELIISTISFVTSAMASYFIIRRSRFYEMAYCLNDAILITMWMTSVLKFGIAYLPTVITFVNNFIIDAYGYINLTHKHKQQHNKK